MLQRTCAAEVSGYDAAVSAIAAWDRWFASRLGAGACRSFFQTDAQREDGPVAPGAHYVSDLRARVGQSVLTADDQQWSDAQNAISSGHTPPAAFGVFAACQP